MARLRLPITLAAVVLLALVPAACSGGGIALGDAWARPSMGMERAAAAYLLIGNTGDIDDTLVGAASPAAAIVEIHETTMGDDGAMAMSPVESLAIPAGETVTLEPGGYHIMLIELTQELVVGETIEITLTFERAGDITADFKVREG